MEGQSGDEPTQRGCGLCKGDNAGGWWGVGWRGRQGWTERLIVAATIDCIRGVPARAALHRFPRRAAHLTWIGFVKASLHGTCRVFAHSHRVMHALRGPTYRVALIGTTRRSVTRGIRFECCHNRLERWRNQHSINLHKSIDCEKMLPSLLSASGTMFVRVHASM